MPILRPRLTDFHNLFLPQAQLDYAIPFLDEDIPLYLDPFLLDPPEPYSSRSGRSLGAGAYYAIERVGAEMTARRAAEGHVDIGEWYGTASHDLYG
jgi:hypothetical protein